MFTLHTKANCLRGCNEFSVSPESIICNDVTLPREFDMDSGCALTHDTYDARLWLIGHSHGPVCAIWASCEQDALDAACDANMMECFLVSEDDLKECIDTYEVYTALGNAGELHNLDDCWIAEVEMLPSRDIQLIVKFARAAEGSHDTLDF